jgi:CelD/BcsL family acetyltransferase involved in cellulose biosynthesis
VTALRTGVAHGVAGLDALRETYDTVAPLPVTARWAWLRACATHFPDRRPVAVTVRDGGTLAGAALLATRRAGPLTLVTLLGDGRSDYAALPARDGAAATALARGVHDVVGGIRGPWRLRFDQVPAGDPVLQEVTRSLRCASLVPGDGAPAIRFDGRGGADAYASKNLYKQLRKAQNRLRKEGVEVVTDVLTAPADIATGLRDVARVHVERDRDARGASDFDDPRVAAFWREVLLDGAQRGEVEVTTIRIGGVLAAYAVCFADGAAYRFWDARYAPAWARYGLGRLLDHDLLDRVIADGRWAEFDWMRGEEPYKLQTATDVVPYERLTAWSSPAVRRSEALARSARDGLLRARAARAGRRTADEDRARHA